MRKRTITAMTMTKIGKIALTEKDRTAIKNMRWVRQVRVGFKGTSRALVIDTKDQSLRTPLTHTLRWRHNPYDDQSRELTEGKRLPEKVIIPLPRYRLVLTEDYFYVQLTTKPNPNTLRFGVTPQYHQTRDISDWNRIYRPCYGYDSGNESVIEEYRDAKTWDEKAYLVAVFLQSAIPHYSAHWYRTKFAYTLGLVGEAFIEKDNTQATINTTT